MSSPKRLARIAGLFYLVVGIFGGFAEGFVDPTMYVAGNAAATAGNVVANAGLIRMGVVAHLVDVGHDAVDPGICRQPLLSEPVGDLAGRRRCR